MTPDPNATTTPPATPVAQASKPAAKPPVAAAPAQVKPKHSADFIAGLQSAHDVLKASGTGEVTLAKLRAHIDASKA